MLFNRWMRLVFLAAVMTSTAAPQNLRVDVGKRTETIPRVCESVTPASLDDLHALTVEAHCLGAGDMLIEYTYETKITTRARDKTGLIKEESITYEVYIPTLKEGMRTRGILLETARNGVPVSEKELEKQRQKAGERLEKEDSKANRQPSPQTKAETPPIKGLMPIGMYTRMGASRGALGIKRGGAVLSIATFLETCDLKFLRRTRSEDRDTLVYGFTPRANIPFDVNEKYVSNLVGEIWIDVADHIVSRVVGWPATVTNAAKASDKPPAIYTEMVRLSTGVWLPGVSRLNGLDYPKLFNNIVDDTNITYAQYKRFVTDVKITK